MLVCNLKIHQKTNVCTNQIVLFACLYNLPLKKVKDKRRADRFAQVFQELQQSSLAFIINLSIYSNSEIIILYIIHYPFLFNQIHKYFIIILDLYIFILHTSSEECAAADAMNRLRFFSLSLTPFFAVILCSISNDGVRFLIPFITLSLHPL